MKNHIFYLFVLCIMSCTEKTIIVVEAPTDEIQMETQIINQILGDLIPDRLACALAWPENESYDEYKKRDDAFRKKLDSLGLKIEIVRTLKPMTTWYLNELSMKYKSEIDSFVFIERSNQFLKLDGPFIKRIDNIEIIEIDTSIIDLDKFSDCRLIGQIRFSKMNFNQDSTRAVFSYDIYNGSCQGSEGGIVEVVLKQGNWQIKKQ